jgi:dienelactone hydrolase
MRTLVSLSLALFLGGCGGTAPEPAAEPAPTPKPGPNVQTEEVVYSVEEGGTPLKGFIAWDANLKGPRPGVLVVHEWWGQTDYPRERARQLAELGYTAMAVDMYGDGKQAEHPEDAMKFVTEALSDLPGAEARFGAALELLKGRATVDPEKVAAIGYCFGGGVVLHMARIGTDLDGVVSFHGSLPALKQAEKGVVKARVLACHGAADSMVPQEAVDAFEAEMKAAEVDYELVAYEGAKHGFTNPGADAKAEEFGIDLGYDAAADAASWMKMQTFLTEVFSAEPAPEADAETATEEDAGSEESAG